MIKKYAKCYWITGLSAAGKTTLANMLTNYLRTNGNSVIFLDGDELQKVFGTKDYNLDNRLKAALRYSKLSSLIVKQQINVVISVIGLFHEVHQWNRKNIPGYVEIIIDVPMEELKRRDPKKLYERAKNGEIKNVYGLDIPAEFPKNPDVHLYWSPSKSKYKMMEELINSIF